MARTSARVQKMKQEAKKSKGNQNASEGGDGSTDEENGDTNCNIESYLKYFAGVEKITHTRIYRGKRQYLVRWNGYSEDDDTWENESALQSCKEVLDAFRNENLGEENSEDEIEEEAKETTNNRNGSMKSMKQNTNKSGHSKHFPADDEVETENEEEHESEVEGKQKHAENKKVTKGEKRKSTKEKEPPKKKKTDDSKDESNTEGKDCEVLKILEVHLRKDGTKEFLIRWKGCKPSEDTWEPEGNLNCPQLIEKFMDKVNKAKELTRKELRVRKETTIFVPLSARKVKFRVVQRNAGIRPCYTESMYED